MTSQALVDSCYADAGYAYHRFNSYSSSEFDVHEGYLRHQPDAEPVKTGALAKLLKVANMHHCEQTLQRLCDEHSSRATNLQSRWEQCDTDQGCTWMIQTRISEFGIQAFLLSRI